jgi:hypothetical protein
MTDKQSLRTSVAVALTFVALTAIFTYPQVLGFGTSVPFHSDPYFSMWRLGWVAHAILHAPRALFDANIFYPERHTLAYSDAMLLPGVVLAPLFWAGMNPVAIYNLALFAAFALSGLATFVLARELTGSVAASLAAGVIYAFAPYRFGHYMHLELQMVFWIPVALLMVHRVLSSSRARDGMFLGAAVGFQLLSCVYAGIFLVTYLVVFVPCLAIVRKGDGSLFPPPNMKKTLVPLVAAGVVALVLAVPYALAYRSAEGTVGTRRIEEVRLYSASLTNFLSAPQMNRLYGRTAITNPIWADEMNLSPGIVAVVLALLGIAGGRSRVRFAYLAALIFSLIMTAGANGFVYPWLFEHVAPFRGLRSPARFDILVNMSLAVLSAYGVVFLFERIGHDRRRRLACGAIAALLIVEYASAPPISPAPKPSKIDAHLAQKPPAVIVELPLTSRRATWGSLDWLYMYQGMTHFQRMINGYSGYAPASYYQMRETMTSFPDDVSMALLRDRQVDYVVVRAGLYEPQEAAALLEKIQKRQDLSLEAMWTTGPEGGEAIFKVRR